MGCPACLPWGRGTSWWASPSSSAASRCPPGGAEGRDSSPAALDLRVELAVPDQNGDDDQGHYADGGGHLGGGPVGAGRLGVDGGQQRPRQQPADVSLPGDDVVQEEAEGQGYGDQLDDPSGVEP